MTMLERLYMVQGIEQRNAERLNEFRKGASRMPTKIVYNKYSANGAFVGEREYRPKDRADYDRVMAIIDRDPDGYELVNCEYGEGN